VISRPTPSGSASRKFSLFLAVLPISRSPVRSRARRMSRAREVNGIRRLGATSVRTAKLTPALTPGARANR
jgi:hypothetical protein